MNVLKISKSIILSVLFINLYILKIYAQEFPDKYSSFGKVYISTLINSAFPNEDRKNDVTKNGKTYTFMENYSDNSVIVFIPKNYDKISKVDLVFFFYGWFNSNYYTASTTDLIQQFIESRKNAVLVFPAMAKFAPDSFEGNFKQSGVFENYVNELIDSLKSNSYINSSSLGNIILCGHSGGYKPIVSILKHGGVNENIKEVYLLDALFGEIGLIFKWIRDYKGRIINISTQKSSPLRNSSALINKLIKANIECIQSKENDFSFAEEEVFSNIFLDTDLDHGAVLEKNLSRFLKMSSLKNINY